MILILILLLKLNEKQEWTESSTSCPGSLLVLFWTGSGKNLEIQFKAGHILGAWTRYIYFGHQNGIENNFQVSDPDANNGRMPLCSAFINLLGGQGVHWLLWSHVSKIFLLLQVSFPGLVVCIWLIYGFSFCHFSTVPAQVLFSCYWYFLHSPLLGHWFVPPPIEQRGCRDYR